MRSCVAAATTTTLCLLLMLARTRTAFAWQHARLQRQHPLLRYSSLAASRKRRTPSFLGTTPPIRYRLLSTTVVGATTTDQTAANEESTTVPSSSFSLRGMEWLQDQVVEVLNELYDPSEVAKASVLSKFNKQKKKKKKKSPDATEEEEEEPPAGPSEQEIQALVDEAVASARPFDRAQAMVTPATKPEFGDYQVNAAMGLAQALGMNPRACAQEIVDALEPRVKDILEPPEIAGPGFVNLRFQQDYLSRAAAAMAADAQGRLAVPPAAVQQRIVVDYSSPNIAKEMHVGHLRSTIIGDTLCNLLDFAGHSVVRLNHVGDWGTQFGMLVEHLRDEFPEALDKETAANVDLGDLVLLYKAAKKRFDVDDEFKARAREGVVKLQAGNPEELAAWESLCAASRVEFEKIYSTLNIKGLEERGESFYNPYLNDVVEALEEQGLAVESEGATVVFLDGYTNRDGSPLPMIVRKSDGGFNYATTDLAAIRQRTLLPTSETGEQADRVLYVTDAGQASHFEMVFAAARLAGFVPTGDDGDRHVSLEHVPFGLVQGADGKKFATRSGDTVKLKDLLNEAVRIAGEDVQSRYPDYADNPQLQERIARVAEIVGVGAVKYADLSMNRESNYKFSYERMLSLNGNTAPYMLYAYARICGIIRKASNQEENPDVPLEWPAAASEIIVSHETERDLVRALVKLPDILQEVERDLYPNRMCDYLFDLSQRFNQFYEACSVNQAETESLKASRLSLCTATAATLRLVMGLLGLQVVEKL